MPRTDSSSRAPSDRQQQLYRVGAHVAIAGLLNSPDTHATGPAAHPLDVAPCQLGRLAHPQPSISHQTYHCYVHHPPPASIRGALYPTTPSPARFVSCPPYGEVAVQVQRECPARTGSVVPREFVKDSAGNAFLKRAIETRVLIGCALSPPPPLAGSRASYPSQT